MKMAVPVLLLLTADTAEEKPNTCTDRHSPTHHSRPRSIQQIMDSRIKTQHNQHRQRKGDRKISKGKGSVGH